MITKNQMRKILRDEIAALPELYITESDRGIFRQVLSLKEFIDARNIMMYYSVGREPDTVLIAKAALSAGKTLSFPYCLRSGIMQARTVQSLAELKPDMLKIPAPTQCTPVIPPEQLHLIIVPALTFDREGCRLGYGGGYYDRFLRGVGAYCVGLARERLVRDKLPKEPHDISVNCVISESGSNRLPYAADKDI